MQCLTPEQERKRDKFLRMRQKKQEEDKTRKEAELEKKRKREEKQREKEMLQRMEEERRRKEELERQRVEQELRIREAQAPRVPDSFATYRHPGPQEQRYDANDDASSYFVQGPTQASGFAEFSGMCGLFVFYFRIICCDLNEYLLLVCGMFPSYEPGWFSQIPHKSFRV